MTAKKPSDYMPPGTIEKMVDALDAISNGELAALRKDNEDLTAQRDVARESLELADKEVAALRKDKARIDLIDRLCQPDNGSGMTLKFGKTTASWSGECPIREELDDIAAVEAEGG